jgi:hypothetical protein
MRHADRAPALAEAYVGAATLRLRADLPLQSATVATLKHGERVEIVQRRRRFMRIRTKSGAEGWTEENQLLNADEMAALKDLASRAARLPSQGQATTYYALNVHTQPASGSPSFLQLKEGDKFDLLSELVIPRQSVSREPLIPPAEKKKPVERRPAKPPKIPVLPIPQPPGPPSNWLDLSKTAEEDEPPPEPEETKPVPMEHWSLVRTAGGQSGWVLTRRVNMAIPDEVAQYAEGHRIVAYFPLGSVQDGDAKKPVWLWATSVSSHEDFDFDSFRVFIWSLKRHRYETAYIERNLTGYLPILLHDVDYAAGGKSKGQAAAAVRYPGFSICTRKDDGELHRRNFALLGNIVRSAGDEACQLPAPMWVAQAAPPQPGAAPPGNAPGSASPSLFGRIRNRIQRLFSRNPAKTSAAKP